MRLPVTGPKPKVSESTFEDLLGTHTFGTTRKDEAKTINSMRKAIDIKEMDPEKLKVLAPQTRTTDAHHRRAPQTRTTIPAHSATFCVQLLFPITVVAKISG